MARENFLTLIKENRPQIIAVFFGTLNALSDGMHFAWSAPTIPLLQREDSPIKIVSNDIVKIEVYFMISGIVGLPITIYLADKIGRKKSVLTASFISLLGWILIGLGTQIEHLIIARCLVGVAGDVAFVCSPMYIAEIAHQSIRGLLSGMIYAMVLGGVLLIYSVAPFVSIRVPPIIGGSILITQLIVFSLMPESPYYHLYKNDEKSAEQSLIKLRGTDDINKELEEISAAIRRQKMERGRPQDLIFIKSNRKAMFIMTVLNCVQHMVGFTAILMNFHTILNEAGATYMDSNLSAIVFAAVMFVASVCAILIVDAYGRKVLYTLSCSVCGLSLLIIGIFYHLKKSGVDLFMVAWIPLVFTLIYAAFFKFGIGVIPIVMTAELFPARIKALGMTAADGVFILFGSISLYLYQILCEAYGLYINFYLFSLVAFSSIVFSLFMLPETRGKTLEEIQIMLKK